MQDGPDFSLRIVVMAPDPKVDRRVIADDHARTTPFTRAKLPGVDLRPEPSPAPRHFWLPSHSGRRPVPSRIKARSLLGVPPPPPSRASPRSDDEEKRMRRRARAHRRIAWAQRLLRRFHFEEHA